MSKLLVSVFFLAINWGLGMAFATACSSFTDLHITNPDSTTAPSLQERLDALQADLAARIPTGGPHAVIFDIDDTCITWVDSMACYVQIPPVLAFYNWVKSKSWKVFFLSARWQPKAETYEATQQIAASHLHSAGFSDVDFSTIICRNEDVFRQHCLLQRSMCISQEDLISAWKSMQRAALTQIHNVTIIATLDDVANNLLGEHIGTPVHIK